MVQPKDSWGEVTGRTNRLKFELKRSILTYIVSFYQIDLEQSHHFT